MIRKPAVSGSFYPSRLATLSAQVDALLVSKAQPQKAKAIIVPHAGYIYSGAVAGQVIASTDIPKTIVLLGPNHYGAGPAISVSGADSWATPMGHVPIEKELRQQLLRSISDLKTDNSAHEQEHSLEVMLPFLLKRQPELNIVPIALGPLGLEQCLALGSALARTLSDYEQDVLLLASSDMNHFSSAEITEKLDSLAIEAMTAYDPAQLYQVVRDNRISMCGVLPVIAVMQAAREMGASSCRIVSYSHSGQVNGDNSNVVGYAGLMIQ